jgi:hypothetical protein
MLGYVVSGTRFDLRDPLSYARALLEFPAVWPSVSWKGVCWLFSEGLDMEFDAKFNCNAFTCRLSQRRRRESSCLPSHRLQRRSNRCLDVLCGAHVVDVGFPSLEICCQ